MRTMLFLVAVAVAAPALASVDQCSFDVDCPGDTCGTQVCQWNQATGDRLCVAAGTDPQGHDGTCDSTVNATCKCFPEGALCMSSGFCTFTVGSSGSSTNGGSSSKSSGGCSYGGASEGARALTLLVVLGGVLVMRRRRLG
jgi:MYXO-CTERM domain-containing protein